ncbi:hypothetical protein PQZ69_03440 [Candidatus Pelagibacter sp.]|nr:hypothetical protein [Candidatus Pelagibacter sp.]
MRTSYNPNQSPRVIIIQKLYGNFFNDDNDLTFPKHRFKKFIKDVVLGTIGQTGYGGTPHAEYNAINNSNTNLEGSKIYVTLEPCLDLARLNASSIYFLSFLEKLSFFVDI